MSYPNSPEDPYGQGGQPGGYPGQDGTGGYMPPSGQPGGYPPQQPGGYPPYADPSGGYPPQGDPSGGYPPPPGSQPYGQPGYGQPGYGPPGTAMGGPANQDERNMAMFAILGGGILGWLVPLIIFLIKKDE